MDPKSFEWSEVVSPQEAVAVLEELYRATYVGYYEWLTDCLIAGIATRH